MDMHENIKNATTIVIRALNKLLDHYIFEVVGKEVSVDAELDRNNDSFKTILNASDINKVYLRVIEDYKNSKLEFSFFYHLAVQLYALGTTNIENFDTDNKDLHDALFSAVYLDEFDQLLTSDNPVNRKIAGESNAETLGEIFDYYNKNIR